MEQGGANTRNRVRLAEQMQRFFAVTLNDDDIRRLLAMSRRNVDAHLLRDVVDFGIIQDLVKHAHDVNDLTRMIAHRSVRQLT
jgi:hypothetical protein